MPDGDGEFAGHRDGGFVAATAGSHGQAPFLERIFYLEESFARLDE
jgi:hypothetical protein